MSRYPTPPPHVERSVEQLLRRQKVLSGADRPVLWAVIEEPVLWRPIAGVDAHIRQLIALTASAQMKGVSIQVNPMGSRFMPGYGPFTIFRSGHSRPQMVAVHGERDEVTERTVREDHAITFDRLSIAACERGDTTALLMRICDRIHVMDDPHLPRTLRERHPVTHPSDASQASAARMYDVMLGGEENFAADREAVKMLVAHFPTVPDACRANRGFLLRSARAMAEAGIDQFLDIGCGLPTPRISTRSCAGSTRRPASCTSTTT